MRRMAPLFALLVACATTPQAFSPVRVMRQPIVTPPPVTGSFWAGVEVPLKSGRASPTLPLEFSMFEATPGWSALSEEERQILTSRGFLERPVPSSGAGFSNYASTQRTHGEALLLSVELFARIAEIGWKLSVAEISQRSTAELRSLVHAMRTQLEALSASAHADLTVPIAMAHGSVELFERLSGSAGMLTDPAIASELARISSGREVQESLLLRVPIDYARFQPQGNCVAPSCAPRRWLEQPWVVSHIRPIEFETVRAHLRAALLLARAVDEKTDHDLSQRLDRVNAINEFLYGPNDDLSFKDLTALARNVGLEPTKIDQIADVVKIEKLIVAIKKRAPSRVMDRATAGFRFSKKLDSSEMQLVRLMGGRYALDTDVLTRLGRFERTMPNAAPIRGTDLFAFFGSPEAVQLREHERDARRRADYGAMLERTSSELIPRVDAPSRHQSVFASFLDFVESEHKSSVADEAFPAAGGVEWAKHALETSVGTWAAVRHQASALLPVPREPRLIASPSPAPAPTNPVLVEPHPEALARLVAVMSQLRAGLIAHHAASDALIRDLDEVIAILIIGFKSSLSSVNDEVTDGALEQSLRDLPARMAALELRSPEREFFAPIHFDEKSRTSSVVASGIPRELVVALRVPGTDRFILAFAPTRPVYEFEEKIPLTDDAWSTLVESMGASPTHDGKRLLTIHQREYR